MKHKTFKTKTAAQHTADKLLTGQYARHAVCVIETRKPKRIFRICLDGYQYLLTDGTIGR